MSILTDGMKDYIKVNARTYPIRTDFRVWLEIDRIINATDIKEEDKPIIIIRLCFEKDICRELPPLNKETLSCLYDFYMCKKPHKKVNGNGKTKNTFSFEYDADYIYAAFLAQYNIDLLSVPYMHWHAFLALFKGLDENCHLMKIISIRSVDLSEIEDDTRRKHYRKLKEIYGLPDKRSEIETEYDFADALSKMM